MSTASEIAFPPQQYWDTQVESMPESAANWVWPGFVARGAMTLLTSMWKSGKTTLLAHLLARRVSFPSPDDGRGIRHACPSPEDERGVGVRVLLDRPVPPGKTVVISEESRCLWEGRRRQFDFG